MDRERHAVYGVHSVLGGNDARDMSEAGCRRDFGQACRSQASTTLRDRSGDIPGGARIWNDDLDVGADDQKILLYNVYDQM